MFKIEILSPSKSIFKGEADIVILPGQNGEFGIMTGHAPLLSNLKKGRIRVKTQGGEKTFQIEGGFVEVDEKGVIVLSK